MKRIAIVVLTLAAVAVFAPRPQAGAATTACHPVLTALTLAKPSVPGGAPVTATIRLSCAGPGATTVRLTGFRGATAPATVRVARGKTSGSASVTTAVTHVTRHGTVGATLGRSHRSARLTITRTPRTCRTPALTGLAGPALVYVGNRPVLTIRLSCAVAAPVRVSLSSSTSDLPVPAATWTSTPRT